VLAYSGRPEAAREIARLAATTGAEIVTVTLDLGQAEDLEQICLEARTAGAARTHVVDARDRFAADVLLPALRTGATGASAVRPTALARPIVAAVLAEVARMEKTSLVAHGGVGADGAAFARLLADHAPDLEVVALDTAATARDTTAPRIGANLWGRTVLFPAPSDAWTPMPATLFTRTSDPTAGVTQPAQVDLTFEHGVPVAVNGIPMSFLEVAEVVDTIAGDHGVGRIDQITGPAFAPPGLRRGDREITEAPAAVTLATALADLERARLDPRLAMLKMQLSAQYAAIVDSGDWYSPTRVALDAFIATAMSSVSGTVRVMLSRGACRVVGRELASPSPRAMTSSSAGVEPAL
jgi:argininosuccinate synthase